MHNYIFIHNRELTVFKTDPEKDKTGTQHIKWCMPTSPTGCDCDV